MKDNYEPVSPEDPQPSFVFLEKVLQRHNINLSSPERQIVLQWKNIAGANISEITECTGVKDGTLYILCKHPAHAGLVRLNKNEILKNVNAVFPELGINKIFIRTK